MRRPSWPGSAGVSGPAADHPSSSGVSPPGSWPNCGSPSQSGMPRLQRAAHSLKGAAASSGPRASWRTPRSNGWARPELYGQLEQEIRELMRPWQASCPLRPGPHRSRPPRRRPSRRRCRTRPPGSACSDKGVVGPTRPPRSTDSARAGLIDLVRRWATLDQGDLIARGVEADLIIARISVTPRAFRCEVLARVGRVRERRGVEARPLVADREVGLGSRHADVDPDPSLAVR